MRDEEKKQEEVVRNIPRNPNRKITDEEVNQVLKSAAEKLAEKENKSGSNNQKKVNDKKAEKSASGESTVKPSEKNDKKDEKSVKKDSEIKNEKAIDKKPVDKKPVKKAGKEKPEPQKTEKNNVAAKGGVLAAENGKKNNHVPEAGNGKKNGFEPTVGSGKKKSSEPTVGNGKKKSSELQEKKGSITDKKIQEFAEEEPIVIKNPEQPKDKVTIGRVIGTFLESVWTLFKVVVLVIVVTAVAGFFLSRDLMIRGRSGSRQCTEGMTVAASTLSNKSSEDGKVKEWLGTVTREKLTLEADDKSILVARKIVADEENSKWVVILHGYNGSMEDIYDIAMHYVEKGYNVLMPDLRAHGESEGSFFGMGWLDRMDVINWIDVILKDNPSAEVVIHGIDIGADAALMLTGEPVKSSVKAIVAEGAYTNAWEVVKQEYKTRHEKWPVFPLLHMINPVMKVWAGYSLKEADAVKQVKNSNIPILLIRGENDTYATEEMTNQLDKAIASEHEVFTVPTGTHEDCRYAEPDNYYKKTFDFVGKYIK